MPENQGTQNQPEPEVNEPQAEPQNEPVDSPQTQADSEPQPAMKKVYSWHDAKILHYQVNADGTTLLKKVEPLTEEYYQRGGCAMFDEDGVRVDLERACIRYNEITRELEFLVKGADGKLLRNAHGEHIKASEIRKVVVYPGNRRK